MRKRIAFFECRLIVNPSDSADSRFACGSRSSRFAAYMKLCAPASLRSHSLSFMVRAGPGAEREALVLRAKKGAPLGLPFPRGEGGI